MKKELETTILELVLPPEPGRNAEEPARMEGIIIGTLTGFHESGEPLVTFGGAESDRPVRALSTVALVNDSIGRAVALQFERGNPARPVILGVIQSPIDAIQHPGHKKADGVTKQLDVELDGERLVFTADKEIVLRCGKASITLTQAGKLIIRGADLLSRSSGVNRIKGGSVQIN
jgi:hypothetical protein